MDNRRVYFLSGPALQLVNTILYFLFRVISEYGRGAKHPLPHAVLSTVLFFAVYSWFCRLYRDFQNPGSSSYESVFSQIISLLFTDALLWMEAVQTWPSGKAPFVTLVLIPVVFQAAAVILNRFLILPELEKQLLPENTLVIAGTGGGGALTEEGMTASAEIFCRRLMHKHDRSFTVTDVLTDDTPLPELCSRIDENGVVILYSVSPETKRAVIDYCTSIRKPLYFTPDLGDISLQGTTPAFLLDTPLMKREYRHGQDPGQIAKRLFDLGFSALLLMFLSPLFLLIFCAIKAEDGGPAIYRQKRYTKDGKIFNILKFRSMTEHAEDGGIYPFTKNDSRVTRVGRILRRFRLDELPQLVNILRGDMSFVGPRPERIELSDLYTSEIREFPERLRVRGGLTGLAQVYGKYNTDPYDKLQMDLMYIENQSLLFDLKIMLLTIISLFRGEGTEGFDASLSGTIHDRIPAVAGAAAIPVRSGISEDSPGPEEPAPVFAEARLRWAEDHVQWLYFPVLLFFCFTEFLYRINWTAGRDSVKPLYTALHSYVNIVVWVPAAAVLLLFFIRKVYEYRSGKEPLPGFLKKCLLHPVIFNLLFFLAANYLIRHYGRTDMTALLLLIWLGGCTSDRKTAAVLCGFYTSGIVLGLITLVLHLSKNMMVPFTYGFCNSLGFSNPNSLGFFIFSAYLFGWYLFSEGDRARVYSTGVFTAMMCFLISGCRTAVVLILFLVVYSTWLKGHPLKLPEKAIRIIIVLLPVIMLALSVAAGITFYPIDDKVHSNFIVRVVDCVYAYKEKGLSLFPQSFSKSERMYYFDNGYFYWIFRKGLIASAGLLLPVLRVSYIVSKKKQNTQVILLLCLALYFCMEALSIQLLLLAVVCGGCFYEDRT